MKRSLKTSVWFVAACLGGALWAADPSITADATSVTVSVPAGYAPGAKLILAYGAGDRGTQFAAWATTRELAASVPAAGGDFSVSFADLGFPDGNCTVRAFFQSEFEKLDILVVDASNDYLDLGILDNQIYGIEYGYTPKGGGVYGKTITALNEGAAGTYFRFEGANSTTKFNFCAEDTNNNYMYKAATLSATDKNIVVARNNTITVNDAKLATNYRTAPIGRKGARVRLNTLSPNTANDHSFGWWYYLKIWGEDGRLLIDFIPVRRTADNVVGFYDLAEKRFVTPTGGGAYGAGAVVDEAFTDFAAVTPPVLFASRGMTLAIAENVATVTVPAGVATGEKLYLVSDAADRGLDVQAWHDATVLSEAIPAAGGTFTCPLGEVCSFTENVVRVFAVEDCTRLASLTANEANDYNDTGVLDNLCYGIEYGYQPINGAGKYGKTFSAVNGTLRLERAGNGNSVRYNYCACNDSYTQVTFNFDLNGSACNDVVFTRHAFFHNGTNRGSCITGPMDKTGSMLRMNNKNLGTDDRDSGKWYYLRLFARSGCKLVDYVPAKRADGVIGFVDLVGRTFVTPTGGGVYTSDNVEQGTVSRIIRLTDPIAYECPSVPTTAEWVGGTDTNLASPANWRCRNLYGDDLEGKLPTREMTAVTVSGDFAFNVASASDIRWRSLKFVNASLAADVDWRGSFGGDLAEGFTLDLAGHTLTVDDLQGSGTITDTGTPGGVLRIDVPENAKASNTGIFLAGALKLLKVGKGEYRAPHRLGADYAGGTVIEEGYAAISSSAHPSGATATMTICTNGVFDINSAGNGVDYAWNGCTMILAGGLLENLPAGVNLGHQNLKTIRLTENSKIFANQGFGFIGQGYGPTELDLNGHTLELDALRGFYFYNTTIKNGYVNITRGGYIDFNGPEGGVVDASTADIEFKEGPRWKVVRDLKVRNLIMRATDLGNTIQGTNVVKILGRFTPYTDYIHNYQMQNGSTIDLSVRTTVYPTVNAKIATYQVTFAPGAKVTIDLHGHEYGKTPEMVMSWPEKPAADVTFVLDAETRRRHFVKVLDDGLYVAARGAMVIYVR